MHVLLSIDDTDNLECGFGTGKLAAQISQTIAEKGWGICQPISRHQLLVHPDVPYTSHNSAMCFAVNTGAEYLQQIISFAGDFLTDHSAIGSDPGLCVVEVDKLAAPDRLIDFGYRAKREVLCKDDAYRLASELKVHLSEYGGTGQGVVGALAGTGLRLGGNDGRLRGKLPLGNPGDILSVKQLLDHPLIDRVEALHSGQLLEENDQVTLGEKVKTILRDHQAVLLVNPRQKGGWETCPKEQLKIF